MGNSMKNQQAQLGLGGVFTYRTKCWKIYFKTLKLIGGNLFNRLRRASKRQLRSVLTSILRLDGGPPRDNTDAATSKRKDKTNWKVNQIEPMVTKAK